MLQGPDAHLCDISEGDRKVQGVAKPTHISACGVMKKICDVNMTFDLALLVTFNIGIRPTGFRNGSF